MMITKGAHLTFIIFISISMVACAGKLPRTWPEKTGRVLEYGTNKPLKDVIVLARWQGTGGAGHAQTQCYHVESTITNELGEFTVPEFSEGFGDGFLVRRHILLSFYSAGHKKNVRNPIGRYYKHKNYYLDRFTGSQKERFEYFTLMVRANGCYSSGVSRRNAFVFFKGLYEEAKLLAKTKEEKEDVKWLREILAATIDPSVVSLIDEELEKRINEVLKEQEK